MIVTGRDPERLQRAADELKALSMAAFDADDPAPLERFFGDLPAPIDHVMVTAGQPHYHSNSKSCTRDSRVSDHVAG